MCFGFLGIQFGFALQNANVSRIFQTLGADIDDIPILWIAAPVTGLLIQPIIGYLSDNTWNRLGRRRPYFLYGAIFTTAAIFFMPNSPALWIAAGTLWIMDASINISMEPFRAFVGDMLPNEQRTTGFAMQSFFIGVGAVVASALPWILTNWFDISNTAPEGIVPDSVKFSFYVGGAIRQPGMWPFKQNLTIEQGVELAGGLKDETENYEVVIFRNQINGGVRMIKIRVHQQNWGEQDDIGVFLFDQPDRKARAIGDNGGPGLLDVV